MNFVTFIITIYLTHNTTKSKPLNTLLNLQMAQTAQNEKLDQIILELRKINYKTADRVLYLLNYASCDKIFNDTMINYLRLVRITRNEEKFIDILGKIEKHLLMKSHFNFVIYKIPSYGIVSSNNKIERISYGHIKDTLEQFGDLKTFDIISGAVYAQFVDKQSAITTHKTINNMLMNTQILRTAVVCN